MEKKTCRITLRLTILSIFMMLIISSFTAVLLFLESQNREIVTELSNEIMDHVQDDTNEALHALFESTEEVNHTVASFFHSMDKINAQNKWMRSMMLEVVKNYPNISFLYYATEKGDIFIAGDLAFTDKKAFFSKPDTPLPMNAAFYWQTIVLSEGEPTETTTYLDKGLNPLASESYVQIRYDPRTRPWYIGAKETRGPFWTPVYRFFESNSLGVTLSQPLFDPTGEIIGITGIDLSMAVLSDYISKETVGKTGKIFVLSPEGDLIVPEMKPEYFSTISPEVVAAAFKNYRDRKIQRFQFEWKGVSYLCDTEPFPLKNGEDWLIVIVVPHDDFFAQLRSTQQSVLLIVLLILGVTGLGVVILSQRLSSPIVLLAKEVDKVRHLDFANEVRVDSRVKEIYMMGFAISQMRSAVQSFTRYVPKEIVQGLFAQNQEIRLGGDKKEVTVLFSDIEGFTTITEAQPTELLMALLAEYFDEMSKIILAAGGTIDKYIGDSVMAFWGAPKPCPEQAAICAETVLRCHAFVKEFNRRCLEKKLPVFKTRFGINSGVAIVGNIGTPERMNYTLIGDMVNAASRIQVKNKDYGTSILLGEATQKQLGERFVTRLIDRVEVKGKREKIALYELMGMK